MEIFIESKIFKFGTILSSVSFRVEKVRRKFAQIVDLKLNEAVWIISFLRSVLVEGYHVGKWSSKSFGGRFLSLSCKANRAGRFAEFAIFGAKRKLKTLIIPIGVDLEGLEKFAMALAATTAGPEKRDQGVQRRPVLNTLAGAQKGLVDIGPLLQWWPMPDHKLLRHQKW